MSSEASQSKSISALPRLPSSLPPSLPPPLPLWVSTYLGEDAGRVGVHVVRGDHPLQAQHLGGGREGGGKGGRGG